MGSAYVFSVAELEDLARNSEYVGTTSVMLGVEDFNSLLDMARASLRLPDMIPGKAISTDMAGTTYEVELHAALYHAAEAAKSWRSGLPYDELVAKMKQIEEQSLAYLDYYSRR